MKSITVEVRKVIVVTVEAANYPAACREIKTQFDYGEYDDSWRNAEPQFLCLDAAEIV